MVKCEIVTGQDVARAGKAMLNAMFAAAECAGVEARLTDTYSASTEWMMTYGLGHAIRGPWWRKHRDSGRMAIAWDLGYWQRNTTGNGAMRLTVNHNHPQALIDDRPSWRFDATGIQLRNDYDPKGPIILVGLGPKTNVMLKQGDLSWENEAIKAIRKVYPKIRVLFRPKPPITNQRVQDTVLSSGGSIESVLQGASLVVCRHSNVAVDACIAGVPVVCEDGAAVVLYGNDLSNPKNPTSEERLRFLRNLAWWNWKPVEAAQCWKFLTTRLGK